MCFNVWSGSLIVGKWTLGYWHISTFTRKYDSENNKNQSITLHSNKESVNYSTHQQRISQLLYTSTKNQSITLHINKESVNYSTHQQRVSQLLYTSTKNQSITLHINKESVNYSTHQQKSVNYSTNSQNWSYMAYSKFYKVLWSNKVLVIIFYNCTQGTKIIKIFGQENTLTTLHV